MGGIGLEWIWGTCGAQVGGEWAGLGDSNSSQDPRPEVWGGVWGTGIPHTRPHQGRWLVEAEIRLFICPNCPRTVTCMRPAQGKGVSRGNQGRSLSAPPRGPDPCKPHLHPGEAALSSALCPRPMTVASAVFPKEEALPLGELGPSCGVLPVLGEPSQLRSALPNQPWQVHFLPLTPRVARSSHTRDFLNLTPGWEGTDILRRMPGSGLPRESSLQWEMGRGTLGSVQGEADPSGSPLAPSWQMPGTPQWDHPLLPSMTGCAFSTPPAPGWRGHLHVTGQGRTPPLCKCESGLPKTWDR